LKHALQAQRERQRGLAQRLTVAAGRMQLRADARTDALAVRLQAVDPRRVLARGYAWVTDEQGQAVVSSAALHAGQRVRAVWADGVAEAKVERIEARTGKDAGRRSAG
jgi:exodeoxyribonuclease VII large subunit